MIFDVPSNPSRSVIPCGIALKPTFRKASLPRAVLNCLSKYLPSSREEINCACSSGAGLQLGAHGSLM